MQTGGGRHLIHAGSDTLACHPQAVFDLPRKLRAAIDREALEVAADAYADAAPLLRKYGHKVGAAALV